MSFWVSRTSRWSGLAFIHNMYVVLVNFKDFQDSDLQHPCYRPCRSWARSDEIFLATRAPAHAHANDITFEHGKYVRGNISNSSIVNLVNWNELNNAISKKDHLQYNNPEFQPNASYSNPTTPRKWGFMPWNIWILIGVSHSWSPVKKIENLSSSD